MMNICIATVLALSVVFSMLTSSSAAENGVETKLVIPNAPAKPLGLKMRFEYLLLGTASVVCKSALQSYSSAENFEKMPPPINNGVDCYIGSFGTMPGVEKRADQDFVWRNGGGKTSFSISNPERSNPERHLGGGRHPVPEHRFKDVPSPTVPKLPLPPVPQPPKTAYKVDAVPLDCGSGDYIVSNSKLTSLQDLDGTLRIFLQNVKITKGAALELSGVINNVPRDITRPGRANIAFAGKPQSMQIYYDGDGIIKLDDNTKFIGVIYAPRARVELGRCEVWGAIIARDIVADPIARIHFDRELLKVNEL